MSVLVAVIGGGPAGATCAYHLARAGVEVLLFERDILWEKPCGGGLTPRVFRAEPDLLRLTLPWREVFDFNLVGPAGRRVRFDWPEPIRIIARGPSGTFTASTPAARSRCTLSMTSAGSHPFEGRISTLVTNSPAVIFRAS